MSNVSFKVDKSFYESLLKRGTEMGLNAVAEQVLTDSNEYVKYDLGTLHDSARIEGDGKDKAVTWDTPYALRQYYTGTPINHGKGQPSLQWAHKAKRLHGDDWLRIITKSFAEGLK